MALTHAILTALLDDDFTGYELAKKFDVSLGFFWRASHQQIYQSLKRLSSDGLIDAREVIQTGKPDKRIYSLKELGRQHLDSWVVGETKKRRTTDELFIKLYNVGYSSTETIVKAVEQRQQDHQERLVLYRKIQTRNYADPTELPDHKKGIYLALLAGIHQEQSGLAWCDEALVLLASVD